MMNYLALVYDEISKTYSYTFTKEAPSNCQILDFKSFKEIYFKQNFILLLGNIWYGDSVLVSNSLIQLAGNYPLTKFYFKMVLDDNRIRQLNATKDTRTEFAIYFLYEDFKLNVFSERVITKVELNKRLQKLL